MKQFFTAFLLLALCTGVKAQVLYHQDFEDGFQDMILIDNDGKTPASDLSTFTEAWNIREDASGQAAISISWYAPPGRSDDWMITPVITGITEKTVLEWDARAVDPSYPDGYKVLVSVGGTAIADFTGQLFQIDKEIAGDKFTHRFVVLDEYVGEDIHIAFVNNSNDQFLLVVDNITVRNLKDVDGAFVKIDADSYVRPGVATYVNYTIKNDGFETIDTVAIAWSDGINSYSETLTGLDLQFGDEYEGTFSNTFTAVNPDEYPLNFTITSVGSNPDELVDNNSVATAISGVSAIVPKRVVAEEATGTWCGWCPRGAVYMELMHQAYPDLFIPLAVHNGTNDPMKNVEYDAALTSFPDFPGFPSVVVDRRTIIDPLDLESTILDLQELIAPVDVTVQATIDSLGRKIYIEGKITTYSNRTTAKYNLVLVVAENDVRGTGTGYRQVNYYAGGGEGEMGGYENLADPVPAAQMKYDFVGRKLLHGFNGKSGIVPATFHENDEFEFTSSFIFPATYDMDQLYVVAMVLDSVSGVVLNAAKSDAVTSGVKDEIKELGALKIYPNPAQGTAFVDLELTEAANVRMELVNQLGQIVITSDQGKLPAGRSVLPLKVAGLPTGMYLVKMNIAGQSLLRKLVIE